MKCFHKSTSLSPWFKNFLLNLGLNEILPGTKALFFGNEYQIISGNMPKDFFALCHPFESPMTKARAGDHSLLQAEVAWAMPPVISTSIRAGTSLRRQKTEGNKPFTQHICTRLVGIGTHLKQLINSGCLHKFTVLGFLANLKFEKNVHYRQQYRLPKTLKITSLLSWCCGRQGLELISDPYWWGSLITFDLNATGSPRDNLQLLPI